MRYLILLLLASVILCEEEEEDFMRFLRERDCDRIRAPCEKLGPDGYFRYFGTEDCRECWRIGLMDSGFRQIEDTNIGEVF